MQLLFKISWIQVKCSKLCITQRFAPLFLASCTTTWRREHDSPSPASLRTVGIDGHASGVSSVPRWFAHLVSSPKCLPFLQLNCCRPYSTEPNEDYAAAFRLSVENPEQFWAQKAERITWFKKWTKTMDNSDPPFTKWFVDGELNICYNAVDRHVANGKGDQAAIIYDSPVTGTKNSVTYSQLLLQVSKLAGVLAARGVRKGDRVVIYMPMIPEAMYTMLACARIGAIHSLIFGGFASKELSVRIDHAKPKLIVTASFGIEPGKKLEYIPLVEKALGMAKHKPEKILIYSRPNMQSVPMTPGRDLNWEEEMLIAKPHDCVPLSSEHPLYILYTSGTTGLPKGVVRPTGGYAVMLSWTMSAVYGMHPGEVWWAASDLGWVVGHSYICYGPLMCGNTTVLFEGKPVGTPDAGTYFRLLSEHGVAALFTAPSAIRAIRQKDPEASLGRQYDLTKFRTLFVAGERCDIETLEWCKKIFKTPVLDHWWQTETGSPITASCVGLGNSLSPPAGQAGKPVPGYNVMILNSSLQQVKAGTLAHIMVKLPLPPGAFSCLWENEDAFRELYFSNFPGYYDTMDAGYVDEDGYVYVMARIDDVINVSGHRISASAIEEAVLFHPAVTDCAVVAKEDTLKGHIPLALCVLADSVDKGEETLENEIVSLVREKIGPVAAFKKAVFVKHLPKTRSGKIPRSSLAALVNGKPYNISSTIEDPNVFYEIEDTLKCKL